jgi:hypothetical protein
MNVNTEGINTKTMVNHNISKQRVVADTLQRKLVDVINLPTVNLDFKQSTIMNCQEYSEGLLVSLFSGSSGGAFSDVDPQILIKLKFVEKVDCARLTFFAPTKIPDDSISVARKVKLFVNRPEMDFGDCTDGVITPAAEFEIEFVGDSFVVPLAGSKFSRVSSLAIFIEDNVDDTPVTQLGGLKLEGFVTPTYHAEYK